MLIQSTTSQSARPSPVPVQTTLAHKEFVDSADEPKDSFFETPLGWGLIAATTVGVSSSLGALGANHIGQLASPFATGTACMIGARIASRVSSSHSNREFKSFDAEIAGTTLGIVGFIGSLPGAIFGFQGALVAAGIAGVAATVIAAKNGKN